MVSECLSTNFNLPSGRGFNQDKMLPVLLLTVGLVSVLASLPVLPITIAAEGTWTPPGPGGQYYGDTRAVVTLPPSFVGPTASAQIFWRRRDPNPSIKEVFVVSAATGKVVEIVNATVESTCGLIYFAGESIDGAGRSSGCPEAPAW